jgi:hexosaminidase
MIITAFLALCTPSLAAEQSNLHLMPAPEQLELRQGKLRINGNFSVTIAGNHDPRIISAISRMIQRVQQKTGIPFAPSTVIVPAPQEAVLQIHCGDKKETINHPTADESYQLEVTERGARLSTASPTGILRGLETFLQLIDLDKESFFIQAVKIEDRPRFRWRGLHIDVSRHWQPVDVILRNLDGMAAVKMNVFHWHLSDDQGFRVESRKFPKLQLKGSDGNFYTQAEVKMIVSYAYDRGIRVIPEFDMPGHTTALIVAYPELAGVPGPYQIERSWGVFDPCMDPSKESLYVFLNTFIGEMAALFPDPYFHTGGDEVNGKQWDASARIKAFKSRKKFKNNSDLQAYFNQRLQKILAAHGKKMIGWNEILHPALPKSVMVQSWQGQNSLIESARMGHDVILSRGYYLDHMRPASFHYGIDPGDIAGLTNEESARIIGGEACMWAEFVNPDNIESRIWPRTAAIAERLWSPQDVKDVRDMYRRLEYVSRELDALGLKHQDNHLAMIRRIAGNQSIIRLKQFADLLVPTGLGPRQRSRKYYSYTPLNRLVDAVFPESDTSRHLNDLVDDALIKKSYSSESSLLIREMLTGWIDHESLIEIKMLIEESFLLEEIKPLLEMVTELSQKGFEALRYLESQEKPPEAWQIESADLLTRSEKPIAEMLPAIAIPIKKLIEAANALPER